MSLIATFVLQEKTIRMGNWAKEINETIESKLKDARDKDLRFLRMDEFKRNITRIDTFSESCSFCQKHKVEVVEAVSEIDKTVNEPGETRRNYDRLIYRISKHMQKEHKFYPPYYFAYHYSFIGMVAGLILGFILMKTVPGYSTEMLSIGFSIGLIPGYIFGAINDRKIRSEKRIM